MKKLENLKNAYRKMENLRLLPAEFTGIGEVNGFQFKRIIENPKYYVYQVTDEGKRHFELIKRVINKKYNKEYYPKSKEFGIKAWTARTLERINQLIKEKFE